jgi:hypothetical protein
MYLLLLISMSQCIMYSLLFFRALESGDSNCAFFHLYFNGTNFAENSYCSTSRNWTNMRCYFWVLQNAISITWTILIFYFFFKTWWCICIIKWIINNAARFDFKLFKQWIFCHSHVNASTGDTCLENHFWPQLSQNSYDASSASLFTEQQSTASRLCLKWRDPKAQTHFGFITSFK